MRILIWDYHIPIKNVGGPSGYLYNIQKYIRERRVYSDNIEFLSDLLPTSPVNSVVSFNFFQKFYSYLLHDILQVMKWYRPVVPNLTEMIDLNKYDIIHFHSSYSLNEAYQFLKQYKGKIILTSHSPQPATEEMINGFTMFGKSLKKLYLSTLFNREIDIWDKADYIMFPVYYALEPYTKYRAFREYYQSHKQKFIYCPTGILERKDYLNKEVVRQRIGIPQDSFLISYIGRHNKVKGFDVLKKIGRHILNSDIHQSVYIAVGGQESPIKGIRHPRWRELGWIDYGNDLIAASDLFILPNRETYFDLIALEVLRTGTPVLMTETGGNKYFKEYVVSQNCSGIFFFFLQDINIKNIDSIIQNLQDESIARKCRESNRQLFENEFEMSKFLERYICMLESLLKV